ncbi:MAG TPA: hypothetical protein IAB63_05695 [Candidatus Onthocola gallistercoris]|uniref:Uncharacterized protein n=1 Tax=Candidatus Onthocola gallistercoris TaxID=2840876 RepID=A0A9D1HFU2_9FIRM|nr:hypothetical protein [Candidatus Onthocola gallistercoris]
MRKRISAILMTSLVAFLTISQFGGNAFAGNISDTEYYFSIDYALDTRDTPARTKYDDTSHYMYPNRYINQSYVAWGVGCAWNGTEIESYDELAITITGPYEYYIPNYCYENDRPMARVRAYSYYDDLSVAGVWSPDSI